MFVKCLGVYITNLLKTKIKLTLDIGNERLHCTLQRIDTKTRTLNVPSQTAMPLAEGSSKQYLRLSFCRYSVEAAKHLLTRQLFFYSARINNLSKQRPNLSTLFIFNHCFLFNR